MEEGTKRSKDWQKESQRRASEPGKQGGKQAKKVRSQETGKVER